MTPSCLAVVEQATTGLVSLPLETVLGLAELQTRTDRKYVVTPSVFAELTAALGGDMAALEIEGVRSFRYESVYFDTAAQDSYHGAAYGRRRRFKVRTRAYVDAKACALEVKTEGGRGETVKQRMAYQWDDRRRLTPDGLAFVAEYVDVDGSPLAPALTTMYARTTLVDVAAAARVTCDAGLVCWTSEAGAVALSDHVLIETKSAGAATAADRFLWSAGHRPIAASKFCMGMAALYPSLPANRWNRTLRRYFDWTPDPAPAHDRRRAN